MQVTQGKGDNHHSHYQMPVLGIYYVTFTVFHPFHALTPLVPTIYEVGTIVLPISLIQKLIFRDAKSHTKNS